ncbi:Drebrin-like protein [Liparis tanakae]|uniref:Drebrin-like protein n=1 Tax=Liparis tanakae TaxID=230148 RepID=A0A4Z2FUM1_9TELE|nr:Drebrin-like protein [Liparis tanakae]
MKETRMTSVWQRKEVVLLKVAKASGADFRFRQQEQREAPRGAVGSVYRKVNAVEEIQQTKKDDFWGHAQRDEAARLQEDKRVEKERKEVEEKKTKEREEERREEKRKEEEQTKEREVERREEEERREEKRKEEEQTKERAQQMEK